MPLGWHLIGVWRDQDAPGEWQAVASGPLQPAALATGKGDQPERALRRLADALRDLRDPVTGGRSVACRRPRPLILPRPALSANVSGLPLPRVAPSTELQSPR